MDLSRRSALTNHVLRAKVLGLVSVYLALWCGAALGAVPLGQLAVSWGFSPEQLLAPGGEALVDAFLHAPRCRLNTDGFGRALAWLASALVARVALIELARNPLAPPTLRRAGAHILAWIGGRLALVLLLGLGWFVVRAAGSASWLEASPGGAVSVLLGGLALLALGRAVDAWLSISWIEETSASGHLFSALGRGQAWFGGFLSNGLGLWVCSLGVVVGRASLLALCARWSINNVRASQLRELTALSHLTLLLNVGLELGWYAFVMRVQGRSAMRARA